MQNMILPLLNKRMRCVMSLVLITLLSACSEDSPPKIGQSIVSINGEEITVHQVNRQLQGKKIDPKTKDKMSKEVVRSLIDRELLVQAAKRDKLDRNPNVMSAIQESKMQILAQAYMQNKVAKIEKPTDAEIKNFRDENEHVFAKRKLYAMDEITFSITPDMFNDLENLSNTATKLDQVIAWLGDRSIHFERTKAVHSAEKLPKKLLEKMSAMAIGELVFINGKDKIAVGQLLKTKSQPISVADSTPLIERAITNQKRQQVAKAEMKRLTDSAEIIYLDEAYKLNSATGNDQTVSKDTDKSTGNGKDDQMFSEQVEKGLSGL